MSEATNPIIGLFQACGTIGHVGMPGAPIVHYSLLVNPLAHTVSGVVHITKAIEHGGNIVVQVKGTYHQIGFGGSGEFVTMAGQYVASAPPPAIGSYLAEFHAFMSLHEWNGEGSFVYGGNTPVINAPSAKIACNN